MGGGGGGECEGRMEGRWEVKEDGGRWEGEGIGDDGYGRRLLVFFWTPPFIILCCLLSCQLMMSPRVLIWVGG